MQVSVLSSCDNINRGQPGATVVSTVVSNLAFLCAACGFFQCLRGFSPGTPVFQVNGFLHEPLIFVCSRCCIRRIVNSYEQCLGKGGVAVSSIGLSVDKYAAYNILKFKKINKSKYPLAGLKLACFYDINKFSTLKQNPLFPSH